MNTILINVIISIAIYIIISLTLVLLNGETKNISNEGKLKFDELEVNYEGVNKLESYSCRDGEKLDYRYYSSGADKVLILIHGSGWHSKYFYPLAKFLSENNIARIYTPDLRGHGITPKRRGDIAYINQLEDDLSDFIMMIKKKHPNSKVILGGHSSGGGLAIRFAGSKYGNSVDSYILLSPFLKYNAPTMRSKSGGWAYAHTPRIIGLSMLNNIGITCFNALVVIDFNMPKEYCDCTETLSYTYRLNTGYAPRNYKKDFAKMRQKILVAVGHNDESFIAEKFHDVISKYKEDIKVSQVENTTHMGIVMGEEIRGIIEEWVKEV